MVGVDIQAIESLTRFGGINHLTVRTIEGVGVSSSTPAVVGFNKSGEAYAGKSATVEIKPFTFDSTPSIREGYLPPRARETEGLVNFNVDEITQRINRERRWQQGARSPEAWAHYLNASIKEGIQTVGKEHLIGKTNHTDAELRNRMISFLASTGIMSATLAFASHGDIRQFVFSTLFYAVFSSGLLQFEERTDLYLENIQAAKKSGASAGYRFSLMLGREYERALLLRLRASFSKLVTTINT